MSDILFSFNLARLPASALVLQYQDCTAMHHNIFGHPDAIDFTASDGFSLCVERKICLCSIVIRLPVSIVKRDTSLSQEEVLLTTLKASGAFAPRVRRYRSFDSFYDFLCIHYLMISYDRETLILRERSKQFVNMLTFLKFCLRRAHLRISSWTLFELGTACSAAYRVCSCGRIVILSTIWSCHRLFARLPLDLKEIWHGEPPNTTVCTT